MIFFTVEQIVALHNLALEQSGGMQGLRDLNALESIVAGQRQVVFGEELYRTIFDKAAFIARGIIKGHVFNDGNKRTGMLAGLTLLKVNGIQFVVQVGEIEDFAVRVAVDNLELDHIAQWLEQHVA